MHLEKTLGQGKGLILTLPHSGNWDMAGTWLAENYGGFTTVAERLEPEEMFRAFLDYRESLGMVIHPAEHGTFARLRDMLTDRTTVLVGHSGVGKSTLMNALVPGAGRTTGHVNDATGRGRHTSTSAQALELPGGGWIIDTPGVRSFGLSHVTADRILAAFGDLEPITAQCPRGCEHLTSSPECALDRAVEHGLIRPIRLESFRRLDAARQANPSNS